MVVLVQLEREEEVTGPVIAPLFPQVRAKPGDTGVAEVCVCGGGIVPYCPQPINSYLSGRNARRVGGW